MNASPATASLPGTSARVWACATASAVAGGLLLGVLTNLAQGWLPGAWNQIANSGAVWCVAAFAAGALVARHAGLPAATVAGLCAESGLVVGYCGYAEVARGGMGSVLAPLVWLGMACVAGPLFGVAGSWWRCSSTPRRRIIGLAALAGVFGMEGIHYAFILHYAPPGMGLPRRRGRRAAAHGPHPQATRMVSPGRRRLLAAGLPRLHTVDPDYCPRLTVRTPGTHVCRVNAVPCGGPGGRSVAGQMMSS